MKKVSAVACLHINSTTEAFVAAQGIWVLEIWPKGLQKGKQEIMECQDDGLEKAWRIKASNKGEMISWLGGLKGAISECQKQIELIEMPKKDVTKIEGYLF